mgnify:CR=1 FL=1
MNREYYESFEWFWDKQTKENEMELHEIEKEIHQIEDERKLRAIQGFIKDRRSSLGNRLKDTLSIGDRVAINNGRGTDEGTITKINRTRAVIDMRGGCWNVPFAMISKMGDSDE